MTTQLELLDDWEEERRNQEAEAKRVARIALHIETRRICWPEWPGPAVGELCEVSECVVKREDGGVIYAYMEQVRLLEHRSDGRWLGVIEMGEVWGKPWPKDGTRLLLDETDVWPPTRLLWKARRAAS